MSKVKTGFEDVKWVQDQFQVHKNSDTEMVDIIECISNFMRVMLDDEIFINSLKSEQYDIGLADSVDVSMYGLFEVLNVSTIVTSTSVPIPDGIADLLGIPLPRSYVPCTNTGVIPVSIQPMNFLNRLTNVHAHFSELYGYYRPLHKKLPRPISNKVVHSGGISMEQIRPLDQETLKIFDAVQECVVLFSLGSITNTSLMPHHIKTSFLEAFKRFSACNFIMKTAIDTKDKELFNQYSNVYTMKWINQRNILSHSKTKAFITHAGANSINEAVISGLK
uniref:glucuronosyltransferase n=1 Tax=Acrobeloides nanus TaxID=290746 RepID=A0A914BYH1_9BILA